MEKLVAPEISLGGNFAYDINGQYYNTTTIYGYIRRKEVETSYETLLAIMNSDLCWWFLKHTGSVLANGYFRFKPAYLKPFPFPNISEENDMKIKKIVKEIMHNDDYKSGDINNQINRYVYELYNLDKNDINIISNNL